MFEAISGIDNYYGKLYPEQRKRNVKKENVRKAEASVRKRKREKKFQTTKKSTMTASEKNESSSSFFWVF